VRSSLLRAPPERERYVGPNCLTATAVAVQFNLSLVTLHKKDSMTSVWRSLVGRLRFAISFLVLSLLNRFARP